MGRNSIVEGRGLLIINLAKGNSKTKKAAHESFFHSHFSLFLFGGCAFCMLRVRDMISVNANCMLGGQH
jgi:hypothetical protein